MFWIRLFWRPKVRYFPDKHKGELQGALAGVTTTSVLRLVRLFVWVMAPLKQEAVNDGDNMSNLRRYV